MKNLFIIAVLFCIVSTALAQTVHPYIKRTTCTPEQFAVLEDYHHSDIVLKREINQVIYLNDTNKDRDTIYVIRIKTDYKLCGAITKTGTPCKNKIPVTSTRCYHHSDVSCTVNKK